MRLKDLRLQHNLLQKDIAGMLNCSIPVYCRYEKGEREPPFETIQRLADFYGVTVDYLMGRDEVPAPQPTKPLPPPESIPEYLARLTPENRAFIEDMAKRLLAMQQQEDK